MNSFIVTANSAVYTARLCYRKARLDCYRLYITTLWAIAFIHALCIVVMRWVDRVVEESLTHEKPPHREAVDTCLNVPNQGLLDSPILATTLRISAAKVGVVQRRSPRLPEPVLALATALQRVESARPCSSDSLLGWSHSHKGRHRLRWRSHPTSGLGALYTS